jgi:hypothetical protein
MKKNEMYYVTHADKINKESYRSGLNLSRFAKYLLSVLVSGESPLEHRPAYVRRQKRY